MNNTIDAFQLTMSWGLAGVSSVTDCLSLHHNCARHVAANPQQLPVKVKLQLEREVL